MAECMHLSGRLSEVSKIVDFALISLYDYYILVLFDPTFAKSSLLGWRLVDWVGSFYLWPDYEYFLFGIAVLAHVPDVSIKSVNRYISANEQCEIVTDHVS